MKCNEKCEVFSRCCGYFRPVANFNKGKKEEVKERKMYNVQNALNHIVNSNNDRMLNGEKIMGA
jgi:hypothetical protein